MSKKILTASGPYVGSEYAHDSVESPKRKYKILRRVLLVLGIVALVVYLLLKSAVPILKFTMGIHDPRVENEASILSTALKYKLDTAGIVTVSPDQYQGIMSAFNGVPEGLVFDKRGNYIAYKKDSLACNAGLFGFIPALDKNVIYKAGAGETLASRMSALRDVRGNPLAATLIDPGADYYILISWTAFTGSLNKDHVKVWEGLAAANRKAKIQVIKVNLDIQQWWPQPIRDSLFRLHSKI